MLISDVCLEVIAERIKYTFMKNNSSITG